MIPPPLVEQLTSYFGDNRVALIALVEGGKKPTGELQSDFVSHVLDRKVSLLERAGLNTHVPYDTTIFFVPPCRASPEMAILNEARLDYSISARQKHFPGFELRIEKAPKGILFWKDPVYANPDAIWSKKSTEREIGTLLGFPDCCITAYEQTESSQAWHFHNALRNHYTKYGIADIAHNAFHFHVPCAIDCKSTRELNYGEFLEQNYEELYLALAKQFLFRILADPNSAGQPRKPATTHN